MVIGTGGFASGPLLQMAVSKGVPSIIQEQNSYPGITNKLLSKKVQKICVAYDGLERFFPKNKIIKTPIIQNMTIALSYPKYTNKNNQLLVDTGNLFIPEGTKIIWQVTAYQTDTVSFLSGKQRNYFTKTNQNLSLV